MKKRMWKKRAKAAIAARRNTAFVIPGWSRLLFVVAICNGTARLLSPMLGLGRVLCGGDIGKLTNRSRRRPGIDGVITVWLCGRGGLENCDILNYGKSCDGNDATKEG